MSHSMASPSGWAKLRDRQPVRIWQDPTIGLPLGTRIARWNQLAGWSAIVVTTDEAQADVEVRRGAETWVECLPDEYSAFTAVTLWWAHPNNYWRTFEHELGHAVFGFADHINANAIEARGWDAYSNPLVCDDSYPEYPHSPYKGIMSYCDQGCRVKRFFQPGGWYGPDDAQMMRSAWGFP